MAAKVQIQVVTWNSKKHLEAFFQGINRQYHIGYSVLVIDNNSTDGTLEWLRKNQPAVPVIRNMENKGFAGAHNQGIASCASPYVLVLNPDCALQEDYLLHAVTKMEENECIGSVAGKLYRTLPNNSKNGILDSCGLHMTFYGKVCDIGENSSENAKFERSEDVFGVTGACALYRAKALKSVHNIHGYFDERFHAYKEDVDLAWRLKRKEWKCVFVPQAQALHIRSVRKGDRPVRSHSVRYLSIRNHLLMLRNNLQASDFLKLPFIGAYELLKFVYILIMEPKSLAAYIDVWRA